MTKVFTTEWDRLDRLRARHRSPISPLIVDAAPTLALADATLELRHACTDDSDKLLAHFAGLQSWVDDLQRAPDAAARSRRPGSSRHAEVLLRQEGQLDVRHQ